jgi:hypothetical protein
VRKEARTRFLEKKAELLLDDAELEYVWEQMLLHKSKPHLGSHGNERVRLASPRLASPPREGRLRLIVLIYLLVVAAVAVAAVVVAAVAVCS